MAESLTEDFESLTTGKKKTQSRAGRHQKQKKRVEKREIWLKESEIRQRKVYESESAFFDAFIFLEKNLSFKCILDDERNALSRMDQKHGETVQFLRWGLKDSKIPFSNQDGSVSLADLEKHFQEDAENMILATSPVYSMRDGKRRMIVYEVKSLAHRELRISALGGHGFPIYAPPGHSLITWGEGAKSLTPLIHDTSATADIHRSGGLSAMKRPGGVNFCVKKSGGYRPRATHEVSVDLPAALAKGLSFFENRLSGLVFGVGKWREELEWWDGQIPLEFLSIKTRKV